jgi:hypothetical protein
LSVDPRIDTPATSSTILGVLAVSPEPSVKMRPLCIGTCTHRLPLPPRRCCRCFSSMAFVSSHGCRISAALRNPRGCRSRSGRTRRRGPICRRGSLIRRARNRPRKSRLRRRAVAGIASAAIGDIRQTTPPHGAMQRGRRRRGKSGGPPRPREQLRPPQGPVSACAFARQLRLAAVLNLFHSVQTKPCLGYCITRGLGLRRQATIFRLRGAALFWRGRKRASAGIRTRPRG